MTDFETKLNEQLARLEIAAQETDAALEAYKDSIANSLEINKLVIELMKELEGKQ